MKNLLFLNHRFDSSILSGLASFTRNKGVEYAFLDFSLKISIIVQVWVGLARLNLIFLLYEILRRIELNKYGDKFEGLNH